MKTHFNDPDYGKKVTLLQQQSLNVFPPSIPYVRAKKKSSDEGGYPKDSSLKVYVPIDKDDIDGQSTEWKMATFESGTPEEFIKWRLSFEELVEAYPLSDATKKHKMILTLLKGDSKDKYATAYASVDGTDEKKKYQKGIVELTKYVFNDDVNAWRRQRNYMRYHLFFLEGNFKEFRSRIEELNRYLPYFPLAPGKRKNSKLEDDEILEIVDRAKPIQYQQALLVSNYDPYSKSLQEYSEYLERLEASAKIDKILNGNSKAKIHDKSGQNKRKRDGNNKNDTANDRNGNANNKSRKPCSICGKFHKGKCWKDPKNAHLKPDWAKKNDKSEYSGRNSSFSTEQVNMLIKALPMFAAAKQSKPKKRKVTIADDEDEANFQSFLTNMQNVDVNDDSENESTDYSTDYCYSLAKNKQNSQQESTKRSKNEHLTTEIVGEIHNSRGQLVSMRVLLDSGTTSSIILRDYVTKLAAYRSPTKTPWQTLGGTFYTRRKQYVDFCLPEFSNSRSINWKFHIDETTKPDTALYDMIIGTDLMEELGIDISFKNKDITWDNVTIPMRNRGTISSRQTTEAIYSIATSSPLIKMSEDRHNEITKIMYAKVDVDKYCSTLQQLNPKEQQKLAVTLKQYAGAYEGMIGSLKIPPVSIDLKPGSKPYSGRPFPIPKAYEQLTKDECRRFEKAGVWEHNLDSQWAAPSFIVPKKTGDVRIVTDLRELNKCVKRTPYPIPKILDILQKLERFKYATAVDLRKGYYHINLDKQAQAMCTTVLPWGKYSYKKLPMGLISAPDIFQKAMNDIFNDLDYVIVYLDDILILSNQDDTFDDHLRKIDICFKRMHHMGMKVNLTKTEFFQSNLDYLGYTLTPHGIKPQTKKVEAMQRILAPKTRKQLRRFLGMVNYYRDVWKRRSHVLAPLATLAGRSNKKYIWTEEHQKSFENAKNMISREAMLAYPDFSKEFHVYADASDYQLGGVIMQENKPLAFYTRKLNTAQSKYPTGEQELLSIVETLKNFEGILLGQKVIVHTDHLNLLYKKLASNRLIRWRMMLEEYGPTFVHVEGTKNVVADALSRLPIEHREHDIQETDETLPPLQYANPVTKKDIEEENFPMLPSLIQKHQRQDKTLMRKMKTNSEGFQLKDVEDVKLIHYHNKIYVPETLQARILTWYHEYLVHPGESRTENTIRRIFYWPGMRTQVQHYVKHCHECQMSKKGRKRYGHLPPKTAETIPWARVNVDLIGEYIIKTPTKVHKLRAMTMIDPATGWFEIAPVKDPNSHTTQRILDSMWLSRYPRPKEIGFDGGSEFKWLFLDLCNNYGMKPKRTTAHNPQGNSIIERLHAVLGNAFRTFELENKELDEEEPWEEFLSSAAFAIRNSYHRVLDATPGQLVFGRDMILPIQFKTDWARIANQKQRSINDSNKRENAKRIAHKYKVHDKVLLEKPGKVPKMSRPRIGPYVVTKVFTNGTLNIRKGAVTQRVNIRRVTPYHS